jgi:hypothetical protein
MQQVKWILAAVLFCGISATVQAEVAPGEAMAPQGQITVRGILKAIYLERSPFEKVEKAGDIRFPLERPQYVIESNGERFILDLGRCGPDAEKFVGQLVIVTGTFVGDTISVGSIELPQDKSLIQYVKVTLEGQLQREEMFTCDPRGGSFVRWHIQIDKVDYTLTFADPKVEAAAKKLLGKPVVLTGTLKDGSVAVNDVGHAALFELVKPIHLAPVAY